MFNPSHEEGAPGAGSGEEAAPQAPRFDTIPDIARKLRRIAADIGAESFHIMAIGASGERNRLMPRLDSDYPGLSQASADLVFRLPKGFADMMAGGALPACWAGPSDALPRLDETCQTLAVKAKATNAGLALPVSTERGQHGVAIFLGDGIALDSDLLLETHAACFALFAVIAGLMPPEASGAPAMSKRERECLALTANGLTSEDIGNRLGLSVHTANQYLVNATQKMNAVNRVHAVAKALRAGLID